MNTRALTLCFILVLRQRVPAVVRPPRSRPPPAVCRAAPSRWHRRGECAGLGRHRHRRDHHGAGVRVDSEFHRRMAVDSWNVERAGRRAGRVRRSGELRSRDAPRRHRTERSARQCHAGRGRLHDGARQYVGELLSRGRVRHDWRHGVQPRVRLDRCSRLELDRHPVRRNRDWQRNRDLRRRGGIRAAAHRYRAGGRAAILRHPVGDLCVCGVAPDLRAGPRRWFDDRDRVDRARVSVDGREQRELGIRCPGRERDRFRHRADRRSGDQRCHSNRQRARRGAERQPVAVRRLQLRNRAAVAAGGRGGRGRLGHRHHRRRVRVDGRQRGELADGGCGLERIG